MPTCKIFPLHLLNGECKISVFWRDYSFCQISLCRQFYRLRGSNPSTSCIGVVLCSGCFFFLRFQIDLIMSLTQDPPVGPAAKTTSSQGRASRFHPRLGNKIPHATQLRPGAANWKRIIMWLTLKRYQEDQMQQIGEWRWEYLVGSPHLFSPWWERGGSYSLCSGPLVVLIWGCTAESPFRK